MILKILPVTYLFLNFLAACSKDVKQVESDVLSEESSAPKKALVQWSQTSGLANPESVHQSGDGFIYVSNVAGKPDAKDGIGWISKYDAKGQLIVDKFVGGLNAPKGLRSNSRSLFVSDIDQVVEISLKTGKVLRRVKVPNAKFLNDVEVTEDGKVYVSDMLDSAIYLIVGKKVTLFVKGPEFEHPNGLLLKDKLLYVAAWGTDIQPDFTTAVPGNLYSINLQTKEKLVVTKAPLGNLDGLEFDGQHFLISDWISGNLYSVNMSGEASLYLSDKQGLADIGLTRDGKSLLVPNMIDSKIWSQEL